MQKTLLILYSCLFLVMIGYGISLPVLPFYIRSLAPAEIVASGNISIHVGMLIGVFALMQLLFSPFWGRWSDKTGRRRPLLLAGLAGYAISLALAGMSTSLVALYGARLLNGIFSAAVLPIASAYIVDITSDKMRVRGLAWQGTVIGLGVVTGPALGAFLKLLGENHPYHLGMFRFDSFTAPFFVAALLTIIPFIVAFFWLPESLVQSTKRTAKKTVRFNFMRDATSMKDLIGKWLLLAFISQFALSLFEGTFVLHAQSIMNFDSVKLGTIFMVCGFVMAVAQGTVVSRFIENLGAEKILPIGFLLMGIGLALLMISESMRPILIVVAILAFGMAIVTPCIAVLITHHADGRLGSSLGYLTAANSLGQTFGPITGSLLLVWNIHLPYLLTAIFVFFTAASLLKNRHVTT